MAEQVSERACGCAAGDMDALCVHTNKITDVCLDKDCIEDLRVYLTEDAQGLLNDSAGARARSVELLRVYIDVEELGFQPGYYAVELTFYYRVRGEVSANSPRTGTLEGVAIFRKRVVLYGAQSTVKSFSSRGVPYGGQLPEAVVEVIDPMVLSSRMVEGEQTGREVTDIPEQVRQQFAGTLMLENFNRTLFVTIGQFSTIRLERSAQITVPGGRSCIPQKSCCADSGCQEDPCDLFSRIDFPYQAFYPQRPETPTAETGN